MAYPGKQQVFIKSSSTVLKDLLSQYIHQNLGLPCNSLDDVTEISQDGRKQSDHTLILIDSAGKTGDEIWSFAADGRRLGLGSERVALFNIDTQLNGKIEDEAYQRGYCGLFYADKPLDLLLKGVKTIISGELWFSRNTMSRLLKREVIKAANTDAGDLRLTKREKEILDLISFGFSNGEISDKLSISPNTVKTHVHNLYKKIGVNNRLQASFFAASKKLKHSH